MIDKIIKWLFMFMFTAMTIFSIVSCWITFQNEAYIFTAIFSIVSLLCVIMILIVYTQDI